MKEFIIAADDFHLELCLITHTQLSYENCLIYTKKVCFMKLCRFPSLGFLVQSQMHLLKLNSVVISRACFYLNLFKSMNVTYIIST